MEFDRVIRKFGFTTRNSGDRLAWLEYKGRTIIRTRRSNQRGDLPCPDQIRQQLKLDEQQLREAISCTLGLDDYLAILEEKGLL